MENRNSKKELFERMPVPKAIAAMAVPTIISQLINLIYSIVDTYFIGRTGNSYMVAAVSVVFTLFVMNIAFSNLFGIGGGSMIARLLGQGRESEAKSICSFSFYGSAAGALFYSLLLILFLDPLLKVLGVSEATDTYARQYVWVTVIIGNIPTILSTTIAHLLRNSGFSRQASLGLSGGGILNMILDPIFMFVLLPSGQEVLGAALATLISNTIACVFLLIIMLRVSSASSLSIHPKHLKHLTGKNAKEVLSVGFPSAILPGLFDLANIVLNALVAGYGDLQLAAIGIVMKIERLPNAINIGISQGILPIVAYNHSSGNRPRRDAVMKTAQLIGLGVSLVCICMFELLAAPFCHLFLSTSTESAAQALETLAFAVVFLRIRCLASPIQFLNYHSSYCLQAVGDGKATLYHVLVRELVCYIPFMFLLNRIFGINGLICALLLGELCGALFALYLVKKRVK